MPLLELEDLATAVPELGLQVPRRRRGGGAATPDDPDLRRLLRLIGDDPVHPDRLAEASGASAAEVAVRLCTLELGGWVRSLPGGGVTRAGGR